jgi:hypothetical protein
MVHFYNAVKPIQSAASYLSLKYEDVSLSLCIMLRKRILHIWYLRRKYDAGTHNRRRTSRVTAWNEPPHDHDWYSIDDTSIIMLMKKQLQRRPPPFEECSWLHPWCPKTPWWFDHLFHLSSMKILCVCQESENELIWEWLKLKLCGYL